MLLGAEVAQELGGATKVVLGGVDHERTVHLWWPTSDKRLVAQHSGRPNGWLSK